MLSNSNVKKADDADSPEHTSTSVKGDGLHLDSNGGSDTGRGGGAGCGGLLHLADGRGTQPVSLH